MFKSIILKGKFYHLVEKYSYRRYRIMRQVEKMSCLDQIIWTEVQKELKKPKIWRVVEKKI